MIDFILYLIDFYSYLWKFWLVLLLLNIYKPVPWKNLPAYSRWDKLFNIAWWFRNPHDPVTKPSHDGFLEGKPLWIRKIGWGIRNPLNNFTRFVLGFCDCPYLNYYEIWPGYGMFTLRPPFFAHRNNTFECYAGWKPGGQFSISIRKAHSSSA